MISDSGDLDRLHDIVVPDAAAWWPLAPGWQILLLLLLIVVMVVLLQALLHWQRNCYRREALTELQQLLSSQPNTVQDLRHLSAIAALLKRVAMTAYPQAQVASITGPGWFAFLDRTGGTDFSSGLGQALEQANYGSSGAAWDAAQTQRLAAATRHWIKHHKP